MSSAEEHTVYAQRRLLVTCMPKVIRLLVGGDEDADVDTHSFRVG